MNELSASVISQRLREGDRAAAFIPELRGNLGQQPRGERELREWHALIDLLSGAVAPRKVFLKIDELYDPVKGDWSQALRSPGIQKCQLVGSRQDLESAVGREKNVLGDGKPDWAIRLALSLARSSARKLELWGFLTQGMLVAFSQELRFNRTLQHLELGGDLSKVTGTAWLSHILDNNSTLHTLVLHDWNSSFLEQLAASLPINTTLRHLGLMECHWMEQGRGWRTEVLFFNALGRNRGLRSFALRRYTRSMDCYRALADALATNPTLVDVDLNFVSTLEVEILVERGLLVSNNIVGLTLREYEPLQPSTELLGRVMREKPIRRLELCRLSNVAFLPTLTTHSIVELKFHGAGVEPTWQALADIVKQNTSLRNLHVIFDYVDNTTACLATFAEALAVNQGLRNLLMMASFASFKANACLVRAVAKHPFLEQFDVKGIHCTEELAEMVKTHPSLTTIGCYIDSIADAQALIAAAKANRCLVKVTDHWGPLWHLPDRDLRKATVHVLHSYLEMNRHGRHKLLIEHPFLLADLMGSLIDFRTRINLVMENPEPLIQAIHNRH